MSVSRPETDYSEAPVPRGLEGAPPQPRAAIGGQLRHGRRGSVLSARRVDVAIGVLAGIAAVLFVPGIALAGIGAVVVLLAVGLSLIYRRLRARRGARSRRRRR